MIRKNKPFAALAALPLAFAFALPSQAQTTPPAANATASVAAAPPLVIAEPSPPANMAFAAPRGIVLSRPDCNAARISLGSRQCLKVGSRIEYLRNGLQFATGTVSVLNPADAIVTISPLTADHYVSINTDIRVLEIPMVATGPSQADLEEREWKKFERDFGISALIATGVYYAFIK